MFILSFGWISSIKLGPRYTECVHSYPNMEKQLLVAVCVKCYICSHMHVSNLKCMNYIKLEPFQHTYQFTESPQKVNSKHANQRKSQVLINALHAIVFKMNKGCLNKTEEIQFHSIPFPSLYNFLFN